MTSLFADVRDAWRAAIRHPGLTLSAVLTLGLAIAANSAIFSVVHAVLFKRLPFAEPERLVRITADFRKPGARDVGASQPEMQDYREKTEVFEDLAGVYPIDANVTGGDRPERVETLLVSPSYFTLLGARPLLGRVFSPEDEVPGIAEVAVISHGLWQRSFGGDPKVIGKKVRLDLDLYTIVGVMPPSFRDPGRVLESDVQFWAPSGFRDKPFPKPVPRRAYVLAGILARLKPGVTVAQAQASVATLGAEIRKAYPSDYREAEDWAPRIVPLQDDLTGNVRPGLLLLLGAVGLVLLIAGVNIASLMLARAAERRRELALRRALGASRFRLIRQMLVESLMLSGAGAVLGLVGTLWSVDALLALAPVSLPRFSAVSVDAPVLSFTALLAAASGILVGILPAWQASRADLVVQLNEGSRSASGGRGHSRARAALVASELALALMLLVFASLLLRSFSRVLDVDPGFSTKDTLVARVWLPQPNIPENGPYFKHQARVAVLRDTLRRLSALPGVRAVGSGNRMPLDGSRASATFTIEGRDAASNATTLARGTLAGPGYFVALGIPVVAGRVFDDGDDERGAPVAIVNESFARRAWPGEDPIGKHLQVGGGGGDSRQPWLSVVGLVRDTRVDGLETEPRPEVFRSQLQASSLAVAFVLRADRPEAVIEPMRRAVQAVDPELPVYAARSLQGVLAATLAQRRFAMTLVALFAATALLLSAIGVYGVMTESVQQRRREIGVRMALGAAPNSVARLIVNEGLRIAAIGSTLGVAGSLLGSQLVAGLLFGIRPSDPVTFAAIPALLLVVAALACWLPARRAARLDPLVALRED